MLEATKHQNIQGQTPINPALAAESRIARVAVTVFPLLVVAAGIVGYLAPGTFKPMAPGVPYLLGIIMFCMGLTLTPPDFAAVAKRPWAVALGIVAHYVIMPGAGWLIATALNLEPELAVGLILVGCAPSGTASNVMAFLAKGDVALSVAVASVSTLIAPVVTPLLVLFLAGSYLQIDAAGMVLDIAKTVLLPVVAGLLARLFLKKLVAKVLPALPWASAVVISLIVAIVVAERSGGWTARHAAPSPSRWGCRIRAWQRRWPPPTSVRWPPCPQPCSRCGTTSPAPSLPHGWRAGRWRTPRADRLKPGESGIIVP
jgi:BASS family bile acid:Na+ symporter